MPALKLTEELFSDDAVKAFRFEMKYAEDCGIDGFSKVFNAKNAKEQIEILKKVTKVITGKINKNQDTDIVEKSLRFLTRLLFVTTSKNPIRRFLKSFFLGLPSSLKENVIRNEICLSLSYMCKEPDSTNVDYENIESVDVPTDHTSQEPVNKSSDKFTSEKENVSSLQDAAQWRHNVDAVASLIENFSLGEQCVQEVCVQLLPYLASLQEKFYSIFCLSGLSPVQLNEVMHHILETVKLINRVCQKSVVAMETMKSEEYLESDSYFPSQLFKIDINVLIKDSSLLDCKTTCSMNIWLLLKQLTSSEVLLYLASKTIFRGVDWLNESCDIKKAPDWLTKLFCDFLSEDKLSNSSYLCCCYGFLAIISMETLTQIINKKCLLLDCLLDKFLDLSHRCSDTAGKLLAAKSVSLLVLRIRDFCNHGNLSLVLKKRLHGESADVEKILQFVWTTWEHSVDAIRFTVKDIFENVVSVHLHCSDIPVKDDPFLLKLLTNIMQDVSWSCKGKYPTLSVLVGHLGSTRMLIMNPGIAEEVLKQLQEQTLACYGSDLYEKLFQSHKNELEASGSVDGHKWCDLWLKPVLHVLCGTNKLHKKHTIEYVLPKILNCEPLAMQYIIPKLSTQKNDSEALHNEGGPLGALIMCLRRARALGQLRNNKDGCHGNKDKWCGVVDVKVLQQALVCRDEQIRLDALALLCENQKTSEVVGETELQLIKNFIPNNLTNQNPAFRQHFLSLLKKFLSRMKESSFPVLKKINKDKHFADVQKTYKDFLSWLKSCLFNSLYPGSVFARRSTCLEALALLMANFGSFSQGAPEEFQFHFYTEVTSPDVNSLLFCITDTFEDNKNIAARILIACTKHSRTEILNELQCRELLDISLSLSESTRPQDSMTASYLLSVLVHQPCLFKLLTLKMSDLENQSLQCNEQSDEILMSPDDSELGRRYLLLSILMRNLKAQSDIAKTSLVVAAANKPLYPTIQCMRYCFSDVDFSKIPEKHLTAWRNLLSRFVYLCSEISKVVSPVVCNSSPEGNVPIEALEVGSSFMSSDVNTDTSSDQSTDSTSTPATQFSEGEIKSTINYASKEMLQKLPDVENTDTGCIVNETCDSQSSQALQLTKEREVLSLKGNEDVSKSLETVTLMPEYLIVCCWRSVKEMSLLLGQLTANVTIATGGQGLFNYDQIMVIRNFFQRLLLESKHRGAFELAYAGFVKLADMLWKNSNPALHELPVQLLSEVMSDIRSNDVNSRLCATRRSAGVPFYVQALVSTEPVSTGRQSFKKTMEELLCLGLDETVVTQDKCTAKVHALNILRALFKDSKLRDDVAPYVSDGLKVAILGFKSPLWAVRNSATLLMTVMMTRIFGVKRSKDESTFNRKNCQTGRTFFYHYPCLYQFLLDEIAMATEHVTSQLHPGLYPILMVLGRLFPSSMEGTDTSLNLSAFIPYVVKCCGNPVLKTRVMAAKAIQPLVDKDHVILVFHDLLTLLPCQQTDVLHQNQIHGILLQISKLVETVPSLPVTFQTSLSELIGSKWSNIMECLSTRKNTCLLTREVTLNLTFKFIKQFQSFSSFIPRLHDTLLLEINDLDTTYDAYMPALSQFQATVCLLWFKLYFLTGSGYLNVSTDCDKSLTENTVCDNIKNQYSAMNEAYFVSNSNSDWSVLKTETVIMQFLRSRSYEVREISLRNLSLLSENGSSGQSVNQLCDKEAMLKKFEVNLHDQAHSEGQGHKSLKTLTKSENIQSYLLSMVETEDDEECQLELFSLLGKWWPEFVTCDRVRIKLVPVIRTIVVKMEDEKCSDAVTSAKLTFLGTAIYHFLSTSHNQYVTEDSAQCDTDTMIHEVVKGFVQIVQGHTSHVETNADVLLACARSILQNCEYLLGTNQKQVVQIVGDDLVTSVFRSVLDLLQADDLEVRETAATIVYRVRGDNGVVSHPYVAVSDMLQSWIKLNILLDKTRTLDTLFNIMFECREGLQDYDERLFDRGEINTYWDELDFLQMLDKAVYEYTKTSTTKVFENRAADKQQQQQNGPEELKQTSKSQNARENDPDKFVMPTYRTIFLDTHSYESQVLSAYKQIVIHKYRNYISQTEYEVEVSDKKFSDILRNCKTGESTHVWPSILVQNLNAIS